MIRGRKPKPLEQRALEGKPVKRKAVSRLAVPQTRFKPPIQLGKVGRKEWKRVLSIAYWLRETEALAVADRCLCFERMVEAEDDIRKRGMQVRTKRGMVTNPSVRHSRTYRISLQRYDVELGLTTSSRTRVGEGMIGGSAIGTVQQAKKLSPLEAALCAGRPS
jgi:P27 family predicted phage terminase small subunit